MTHEHHTALVWFRRDLRLADNPALTHALSEARNVIPVFIHAPEEESPWAPGAASLWWLHHSLESLSKDISKLGGRLILRQGASLKTLQQLIKETGATLVCWNRVYEPACIARDTEIKSALKAQDIECSSHNAALLFEPWQVRTQQDNPFRVFTPFWRHCQTRMSEQPLPLITPDSMPSVKKILASDHLSTLDLLPRIHWDDGLRSHWQVGEAGAHARLQRFIDEAAADYGTERNRPDKSGTSCMGPYLHFGEISPRQIVTALQDQQISAEGYVRELGWREFSYHLLYHFPHTTNAPLDTRFEKFPWDNNAAALKAWQRGLTGIPLVDAGMRELWHTGWMHNRVRMVVASFLTKNLRIHWLEGARWFWDTLVDADLANNTQGWQWTAGCGADAAPFFRIFNPTLQAERFDPDYKYIRRWLPELARLPDKWITQPWAAPDIELSKGGVQLGRDYPMPIAELGTSRDAALEAYKDIKV